MMNVGQFSQTGSVLRLGITLVFKLRICGLI
jgi:hypothetical protein